MFGCLQQESVFIQFHGVNNNMSIFFLNMLLPSMYTLLETSLVMFSLTSCSIHSSSQGGDVVGSLISNWQWTQTGYFMLFNKGRSFGSIAWHTNSTQLAEDSEIQFPQQKLSQCMNCEGRLHTLWFVKRSIVAFWISRFICSTLPTPITYHIQTMFILTWVPTAPFTSGM